MRLSAGHARALTESTPQTDAPGAPAAVNPAGSVSVMRSIGESVAGWVTVASSAGVPPAAGGAKPTVRSGENAACAGAAPSRHSATASTRVRALITMAILASAARAER